MLRTDGTRSPNQDAADDLDVTAVAPTLVGRRTSPISEVTTPKSNVSSVINSVKGAPIDNTDSFVGIAPARDATRADCAKSWLTATFDMTRSAFEQLFRYIPYGIYTPKSELSDHLLKGKRPAPNLVTRAINGVTSFLATLVAAPLTLLMTPVSLFGGFIGKHDAHKLLPSGNKVASFLGDQRLRRWVVRGALILGGLLVVALALPAVIGGVAAGLTFAQTMQMVSMSLMAGLNYILQAIGLGAVFGLTTRLDGVWRRQKVPVLEQEAIKEVIEAEHENATFDKDVEELTPAIKNYLTELRAQVEEAKTEHKEARKSHKAWIFDWPVAARMKAADKLDKCKEELKAAETFLKHSQMVIPESGSVVYRSVGGMLKEANRIEKNLKDDSAKAPKDRMSKSAAQGLKANAQKLRNGVDCAVEAVQKNPSCTTVQNIYGFTSEEVAAIRAVRVSANKAKTNEVPLVSAIDPTSRVISAHNAAKIKASGNTRTAVVSDKLNALLSMPSSSSSLNDDHMICVENVEVRRSSELSPPVYAPHSVSLTTISASEVSKPLVGSCCDMEADESSSERSATPSRKSSGSLSN